MSEAEVIAKSEALQKAYRNQRREWALFVEWPYPEDAKRPSPMCVNGESRKDD